MNTAFLFAFLVYFAILLCLGLFFHKKQNSSSDFVMGNRSLNFWLVGLSAHASDMSAWLFMGLPMAVFILGLSQAWIAVGLVLGMYINWHFVAPRLRTLTEKYECYTLSSFFEKRFQDTSGTIRLLSASMFILFLTHYLSAGMIGMGILLESLFGINYYFGLTIAMLVVVTYTFVGGFTTVAWTDLFQGLFLLCMIILVPFLAFSKIAGGAEQIYQIAEMKKISLNFIPDAEPLSMLSLFFLTLSWGLGYFGMPHVITKFMGIKTTSELKKSKRLGMSWQVLVLSASVLVGVIAIAYFPEGIYNPQMIFVEMVKDLFHPFVAGFILCAVLAAGMSTMDSQILVCASILSEDLYPHFTKNFSVKNQLNVSRFGVVGVTFMSLLLSLNKSVTIMDTVGFSWAGLGSAFGPLVLMSLYSKKINRYGAIAGILTGGFTVLAWSSINPLLTSFKVEPMIPGFFLSLSSIYLVSYLTKEVAAFERKESQDKREDEHLLSLEQGDLSLLS